MDSDIDTPLYNRLEQMDINRPSSTTNRIVAAIDFGTTYSGYAYTFKTEYDKDSASRQIYTHKWQSTIGIGETLKAPTTALYDPNKKFNSFGYEAEEKYADLVEKKEQEGWMCFRRFKMRLYDNIKMRRDFDIEDEHKGTMEALQVFSDCIKFMKGHLRRTLDSRNPGFPDQSIQWVITVPAIWNENAKQFMREAARKAGIADAQLQLALEPEAAALYCRSLPEGTLCGSKDHEVVNCFKPGGKYMILDLGGGTVDTAVHQVADNRGLVEIYKASGGPWGAVKVDERFFELLNETFGDEVVPNIKVKYLKDWMKMTREFESGKKKVTTDPEKSTRFQIPPRFFVDSQKSLEFLKSYDKLELTSTQLQDCFKPVTDQIVAHVKEVISKVPDVKLILMVGGFSESEYVRDVVVKAFPRKRVIVPLQAGIAVLEGAVLFGFNPHSIVARICRYTYGIRAIAPFVEGEHDQSYKCEVDGRTMCRNIFKAIVKEGETVDLSQKRVTKMISSHVDTDRRKMEVTVPIYGSPSHNPKYTTSEDCTQMGLITIKPPKEGWKEKEEFKIFTYFGRTEFKVKVVNKGSKQQEEATFDFLSNKTDKQ